MPDFTTSTRFRAALQAFDEANGRDPNREAVDGVEYPRELVYARRLSEWVSRLEPRASEALRLAARCQHLCRWEIPRSNYPADRAGYLRWRRELQSFHAERAGEILRDAGYDPATLSRVQALNRKEGLGREAECQVLEDALCLMFLQYQLTGLAERTEEAKLVNALRKSWGKMSVAARDQALRLPYGAREQRLIGLALAAEQQDPGAAAATPAGADS